jgi:hypothetical protein
MLDAHVYTLQPGARGFDTNTPLTARLAQAFKSAQYDFVGRYCWRKSHNRWDLLYVGFNPGLGPRALYRALRFTHYWGAYNDQNVPIVRGFQMQQHERKISDIPAGVPRDFAFDTNTVQLDRLRGLPIALIKSPPNFADVSSGSSSTVGN